MKHKQCVKKTGVILHNHIALPLENDVSATPDPNALPAAHLNNEGDERYALDQLSQFFVHRDYFSSVSLALILSKFGSARASLLLSEYWITPARSITKTARFGTPPIGKFSCGRKES